MTNSQACLKSGENIIKTRLNISSEIADSALDNFGEVLLLLVNMSVFFFFKLLWHSLTDDSQTESDRRKQNDKKKAHKLFSPQKSHLGWKFI